MNRLLSAALLSITLAACRGPSHSCMSNADCEPLGYCEPQIGACVARDPQLVCNPACQSHEECTGTNCVARYSALSFISPPDGGLVGSVVNLQAQLVVAPGRTRSDPPQLPYAASQTDGGGAQTGSLTLQSAGRYATTWNPSGEGPYQVAVSYPDAGLSSSEIVQVKKTGPRMFVTVGPPPTRIDGGADPSLAGAWRRDEVASVALYTDDQYFDVNSVSAFVSFDGGMTSTGITSAVPASCDGGGYCGSILVDLSRIGFPAFRDTVNLSVSGSDLVGNVGSGDAGIAVTRWKWRYVLPPPMQTFTTPAIGRTGTVYVSAILNPSAGTGATFAVSPEGATVWTFDGGSTQSSPSVGVAPDGGERVYIATRVPSGINFYTLDGTSSSQAPVCPFGSAMANINTAGSPAISQTDAGESAFFVVNSTSATNATLVAIRPDAPLAIRCPTPVTTSDAGDLQYPSGIVTDGTSEFFGDTSQVLHQYGLSGTTWVPGWNARIYFANGLAVNGGSIIAGTGTTAPGRGLLFSVQTSDGGTSLLFDGGVNSIGYPSIVESGSNAQTTFSVGQVLARVNAQNGADGGIALMSGPMLGAPAVGENKHVFIANTSGEVAELNSDLTAYWRLPLAPDSVQASPALDCSRDPTGAPRAGRPGVLYVATTNGSLYSFIVDSRGIDTNSAWPKYQHDPRNTGNSSVPLSQFACP